MPETQASKRLNRLIKYGICPAEDATEYTKELKRLAEKTGGKKFVNKQSKFFRALADETRLRILKLLRIREMCVCEIMIALNLTQPTASHHLGILGNAGLVSCRKEGKWVYYSLADSKLVEKMQKLSSP